MINEYGEKVLVEDAPLDGDGIDDAKVGTNSVIIGYTEDYIDNPPKRQELSDNSRNLVETCRKLIKSKSYITRSRYDIANIFFDVAQLEEAEQEYNELLKLPDEKLENDNITTYHSYAYLALMIIYGSRKNNAKAIDMCDAYREINPNINTTIIHHFKAKFLGK